MSSKQTLARKYPRAAKPAGVAGRKARSTRTIENIIKVATEEFALYALAGARVDRIANKTATSKRMIYYHFGSKDGLYKEVLKRAYLGIRENENRLNLDSLTPEDALRALVGFTYDYDQAHPHFVRLVMAENLNQAHFLERIDPATLASAGIIMQLSRILERGRQMGLFRRELDAIDVHMTISALCFFRVSNNFTFRALFGRDFLSQPASERHKKTVCEAVLRLLAA